MNEEEESRAEALKEYKQKEEENICPRCGGYMGNKLIGDECVDKCSACGYIEL